MSKRYRVVLETTVDLEITNDDVIDRTQTDEWKARFYDLTIGEAVAMIVQNCLVKDRDINQLTGWADCAPGDNFTARLDYETTVWEATENGDAPCP